MQRPLGRVGAAELRVEVGLVLRNFCQGVVDLVVQAHLLGGVDVLQRDTGFLAERHLPVAVEGAARIHADGQRGELCIFIVCATEEIAHRTFDGRLLLIVPVHSQDGEAPVPGRCHPDLLDGSRTLDLRNRDCLSRFHDDEGVYLPTLAQVLGRMVGVGHIALVLVPDRIGHAALALLACKVLRADGTCLGIGQS